MPALPLVNLHDAKNNLLWLMNQDIAFEPERFVAATPQVSGVYRMLNKNREVIYVGKAKVLPKRFSSYFEGTSHRPEMEDRIASMQTIFVFEDEEAMQLEYNSYLKYYLPYFNKTTPENSMYLYLTPVKNFQSIAERPAYRRDITELSKKIGQEVEFIGPFTATNSQNEIIKEFQKVFKIPSCSPRKFRQHQKDGYICEDGQFDLCKGFCVHSSALDYQKYWLPIKEIFLSKGHNGKKLFKEVASLMPVAKERLAKRSILDTLNLKDNFDLLAISRREYQVCMTIIEVIGGQVMDIRNVLLADPKNSKNLDLSSKLAHKLSNKELFLNFLPLYYEEIKKDAYKSDYIGLKHSHKPRKLVIIDSGFDNELAREEGLKISKILGYKIRLTGRTPYKALISLAYFNGENALEQRKNLILGLKAKKPSLSKGKDNAKGKVATTSKVKEKERIEREEIEKEGIASKQAKAPSKAKLSAAQRLFTQAAQQGMLNKNASPLEDLSTTWTGEDYIADDNSLASKRILEANQDYSSSLSLMENLANSKRAGKKVRSMSKMLLLKK